MVGSRLLPVIAVALLATQFSVTAVAQSAPTPWALQVTPFGLVPWGTSAELYSLGGGAQGSVDLLFPRLPALSVGVLGEYLYSPTLNPAVALQVASGGLKTALNLKVFPALSLRGVASGGWFYGFMTGATSGTTSGQNPWASASLGLGLNLSEYFSLNLDAGYQRFFGLYNGLSFSLTASLQPAGNAAFINDATVPEGYLVLPREKRGVQLIGLKADQIFPVFKNYYDEHAVAQVLVHNYDNVDAEGLIVTAEVKDYMNGPRDLKVPARLKAGETATLDVYTLFNDRILSVAEATKLGLTLTLKYNQSGSSQTEVYDPTIQVLYRNAMTWEDDRRIAAFVSSRDPAAFGFIRGLLATTRESRNKALSQNLQTAMVVQAALRTYGMNYVKDPTSALTSSKKQVIDSLQFPQETLLSRTGDCDDLTILWCSLLESVGIETMAITTPGHVLMAFALDTTPEVATSLLGSKDKFVIRNGKVWVPVETTMVGDDFLKAWQEGARIANAATGGDVSFYPIREAWKVYAPVVVSGNASVPALPSVDKVTGDLKLSLDGLLAAELTPRATKLQAELKTASNPAKATNSLALLYARYGQYDQATKVLSDLVSKQQYGPAFVNLGNLNLLQKKYKDALGQFNQWLGINPDDAVAVAGSALAYDGLGDRKGATASFERLATLDKTLAAKYSYLKAEVSDDSSRASEAPSLESVLSWKE